MLCFQSHALATPQNEGPVIVPDPVIVPAPPVDPPQQSRPLHSILVPTESPDSSTPEPAPNKNVIPRLDSDGKTTDEEPKVIDAGEKIDQLLTQLVLKNIPHDFVEDKKWGKQAERWDGLDIKRDGFKIKTKRRKKSVNHGTWKKYSAQLINPQEEFSIHVRNMRQTEEGNMGFDVHFGANLKIEGRQSKWVKGMQLYSLSAHGHAKVRLKVEMETSVSMDVTKFPPDLIFKPVAKSADLVVDEFRIDRVSKAGGEIAQQITKSVRKQLDEKIQEKKHKLVKKINKELEDESDRMRLSVVDAVKSKWADSAQKFLPESVQKAMGTAK